MSKTYLELLFSGRVKPKIIAYFAHNEKPITIRQLARAIDEDHGCVGRSLKDFLRVGFIKQTDKGYVLGWRSIRKELKAMTVEASS